MNKELLRDLLKGGEVFLILIIIVCGFLFLSGQAHINVNDGYSLGIYSNSLTGSSAYYNPLVNLIAMCEFYSLALTPLVLLLLFWKKKLNASPWPWLLVELVAVLLVFVAPLQSPNSLVDQDVGSIASSLIPLYAYILAGIILSYSYFSAYHKNHSKS
ncbi:MAG TPA: hypothetical protein VK712_01450 [Verrucomicrobiae bacterium]|jgi:hypothetical protein|nr:hypothetical protein [Verrucomicrobiae bacterium]